MRCALFAVRPAVTRCFFFDNKWPGVVLRWVSRALGHPCVSF